jgi:hypothetical protein
VRPEPQTPGNERAKRKSALLAGAVARVASAAPKLVDEIIKKSFSLVVKVTPSLETADPLNKPARPGQYLVEVQPVETT